MINKSFGQLEPKKKLNRGWVGVGLNVTSIMNKKDEHRKDNSLWRTLELQQTPD